MHLQQHPTKMPKSANPRLRLLPHQHHQIQAANNPELEPNLKIDTHQIVIETGQSVEDVRHEYEC